MSELLKELPSQQVVTTFIVVVSMVLATLKLFPVVWKWFSTARHKVNSYEELSATVERHTVEINNIRQELDKNSADHLRMQAMIERQQKLIEDSLTEREIMLRGMLSILHTLNELGGSKGTTDVEVEIKNYLLSKSHKVNNF